MKVKIEVTLEVDAQAWATDYGLAPKDVRDDVKWYVRNALADFHSAIRLAE